MADNIVDDIFDEAHHTFEGIRRYVNQLSRYHPDQRNHQFYTRLSLAKTNLDRIKDAISTENYQGVKGKIDELSIEFNDEPEQTVTRTLGKVHDGTNKRGNKRYDIDQDHLEHLLSMGCTITTIGKEGLLGTKLHPNTIHNFIRRNQMKSVRERFSNISDEDLREHIQELNRKFPNSGICQVWSMLKTLSPPIIVQRDRVAKLLGEIDPVGVAMRWAQVVPRRIYKVPSPNSLWHIDTHHKLIRWNFVINGCVDGYSRLVVILQVHTDNLAASMLCDFMVAIEKYAIPSRVRADKGGEFTHICRLMDEVNGENRGSFLKGKSIHNVRIERLWRDVFSKVLSKYYNIFCLLEEKNILDIDNPIHLSCLHHTFGRRIQGDLDFWKNAFNIHPIRTERNCTPKQLWYNASIKLIDSESTAMKNLFSRNPSDYEDILRRYKDLDTIPEPETIKKVLPRFRLPLSNEKITELNESIDVLRKSDSEGIDIYGEVMKFVYSSL